MKALTLALLTFLFCLTRAQENLQLIREVVVEGRSLATDRLGNFYVINGPQLKRFNNDGQPSGNFRSTVPGNIYGVDVSGPLHILLFYKEFNQSLFLDRNLTEKSRPVIFSEYGIDNAELVCVSAKGGIWVLDWMKRELVYLDHNMRLVFRKPIPAGIFYAMHTPAYMTEDEGYLYISFPGKGILQFDLLGNYLALHPVEVTGSFQVIRNSILFVHNNKVKLYSANKSETEIIETGIKEEIISARRERNLVFVFNGSKVSIFRIIYIFSGQSDS